MDVSWGWLAAALALPGVFAAMLLWIGWQNLRTRHWHTVMGRIVESRSASRDVRSSDSHLMNADGQGRSTIVRTDRIDRKNFADIAYEYTVAGKTYVGRQVGPGKDHGNLDVVEILKRYPAGRIVSVHYNPGSPDESILERDSPARFRMAWCGIAVLAACIVGAFVGFDYIFDLVAASIVKPARAPLIMFLLGAALFVTMLALAARHRVRTMRTWPTAEGTVVVSRVERATTRRTRGRRTTSTPFYIPRVIYRFRVDGIDIDGDRFGRMVSSTASGLAERFAASFPVGRRLVVHYDPEEPTTAIVEPTAGPLPLILFAITAVLLAAAIALAVL